MSDSGSDSKSLLETVIEAKRALADESRPEAMARRRQRGLMSARQRVAALLDAGSFCEFGALVQPLRDNELNRGLVAPADGIITGTGSIGGRPVNVAAHDFTVHGGSSGKVGSRKLDRLMERSAEHGLPLVLLVEGGGHRIQDGMNAAHFAGASVVFTVSPS